MGTMFERSDYCKEDGSSPNTTDNPNEPRKWNFATSDYRNPRVGCDSKDEETACHIANVKKPSLCEACRLRAHNLVEADPMEAEEEGYGLLQIRQKELIDQQDILVVTDVGAVMLPPGQHTPCDPGKKHKRADDRQDRKDSNNNKARSDVAW